MKFCTRIINKKRGYESAIAPKNVQPFTIFTNFRFISHSNNDKLPPKTDPSYRPSARIRPLLDYINSISMYYYQSFQNISIDESLVGFKSREPIHQYLPNKYHAR